MRLIKITLVLFFLSGVSLLPAKEGMWIPLLLEMLNESEMQSMGMKITAEDIYSVNKSSLKDAIVKFGGGCTGEIISGNGLLLTNHHCGYGRIQSHSSVENDYLTDVFWAMSQAEELPNPGLSVTFIVRIEDVSKKILKGLDAGLTEEERATEIQKRISAISKEATTGTHYNAEIKPFYYGNEYYMFITEVFKDVRLVGAPPSGIGKYGGDTDNWLWPRHTGDFSLFRVYAGPDGKPAEYAEDNVPLKPRHFFPISLKGVEPGDFTMVYGFPARTQEYLTSYAVESIMNTQDPIRIKVRDARLEIMGAEMRNSDKVRIQYASKQSGVSNGWKKWKGEIRGLKRDNAVQKKRLFEQELMARINAKESWKTMYGSMLDEFKKYYEELEPIMRNIEYTGEAGLSLEAVRFTKRLYDIVSRNEGEERKEKLERAGKRFFKDYYAPIDQQSMAATLDLLYKGLPESDLPDIVKDIAEKFENDFGAFAKYAFENSSVIDEQKFNALIESMDRDKLSEDPMFSLMGGLYNHYYEVSSSYQNIQDEIDRLNRTYMKALREVYAEKTFYPDANFTLRLSYGKAEGMSPSDGITYKHYTTIDGVMAKYIPGDEEFDLPEKFIKLYEEKDFGRYTHNGELRVCFIASNHTSGGNSGSPVIDGEGQLIGLNFDRNWEGTMSDINYDIRQCRNISVDIRYVLFIIDKLAGASYLIDEMNLVE